MLLSSSFLPSLILPAVKCCSQMALAGLQGPDLTPPQRVAFLLATQERTVPLPAARRTQVLPVLEGTVVYFPGIPMRSLGRSMSSSTA